MEFIINFIFVFILVYLFYYFFSVRKARRNSKKIPVEVQYLLLKYKIDLKKIRYKKFVNSVALVGSLDIALVGAVIFYINNLLLQLLAGVVLFVPLILISFRFLGKYYQNKCLNTDVILEEEEENPNKKRRKKTYIKEDVKNKKGEKKNG